MDRDSVVELVDRLQVEGLAYLMLLILLGSATIGELVLMTRGDRATIGKYLGGLELRGFVVRVQVGHADKWFPSQKGLSLMQVPTVENLDSKASTTTTALEISPPNTKAAVAAAPTVEKIDSKGAAIDAKLAAALKKAGIGSNAWPGLAALQYVTPAYVAAHDAYRRGRGENTGMLITRLRCGDAVPKSPKKEDPMRRGVADAWQREIDRVNGGGRKKGKVRR